MFELIIIGIVLIGGLILLPVLYEVALWLHRRRFARKLHQMAEAEKDARHNRRASKPAYQLADRVKCRECGKQGSADCEDCPAKMIYDELDEISKRTYWAEYAAICENRREKIIQAIDRQRQGKQKRRN